MNKIMPLFFMLITVLLSCNTNTQQEDTKMINVNVAEFKAKMTAPDVVILDVRTPPEIAQGKIENALEIDVNGKNFEAEIKALDKSKTYLVYCRSGKRSVTACGLMESQGFENLYNLKGGYNAWKEQ